MKTEIRDLILNGKTHSVEVDIFDESDKKPVCEMYEMWAKLSNQLNEYKCRKSNFPEISEIFFCLIYDSWRVNATSIPGEHSSFDCYNPHTQKTIQVKATSVKGDLTSFGPKSKWDELYFLDFYNNGEYDGSFDIYLIPNDIIYDTKVNERQTFEMKQNTGQRPRFSIKKKIIEPLEMKPLESFNLCDL
ncbi:MAG: Bsp6I family type II restriction endonuclease [Methanobrevibacter sp.]|nr:Bsp6I family type II restriction endonuclease [Methanobrevibacter sp.]